MVRKTLNASRLQEEVHRRLHKLQEVVEDGVKIGVPRPQLQTPERGGCNWTMRHFGNAAGFEANIERVLAQVQAEYNLASALDEAEAGNEASHETRDPFGGTQRAAAVNPFSDAKPAGKVDPFGGEKKPADEAGDGFGDQSSDNASKKRPANPFGD